MPSNDDISTMLDAWFAETIQRAPIAWNTDCYNQVQRAVDELKARIAALFAPAELAPADTKPSKAKSTETPAPAVDPAPAKE